MANNMGNADRIIRAILGVATISICPLSMPFGISTRRNGET